MEAKSNNEEHDVKYDSKVTFSLSYRICKRIIDILMSIVALILLSPIFLLVLILNRTDRSSRGPLFYKQYRIGLHGKKFGMYKFRSMVVDAEKRLHANKQLYAIYVNNNYKLEPKMDPRITKIGRFLRETSIDEIPQFINILRGEMSIVGPRPVVEEELVEYDQDKLLSVKPGAMGLWQASGRSKIGYPERAEIEMSYIDHANLWYDLKIIVMNLINIFRREGAY